MYPNNVNNYMNNHNGGNLPHYSNGMLNKEHESTPPINRLNSNNNKQPHFSSSNSLANNSNQMRTSALKTVNISDRPT